MLLLIGIVIFGLALAACADVPATDPTLPIHTAKATVNGKVKTILTDSRGFALYYYLPDTPTTTACSGNCASDWPPLLRNNNTTTLSADHLPGTLTAQQTTNGNQIEYNGHLLYAFISDTSPGQVTGDNVNSWFVATPALS